MIQSKNSSYLCNHAATLLFRRLGRLLAAFGIGVGLVDGRHESRHKDVPQAFPSLGGALDILCGSQLLCHSQALLLCHKPRRAVLTTISLSAHQDERDRWGVLAEFRHPLVLGVLQRTLAGDREADKEDIGIGIGEWSKTIIVFLSYSKSVCKFVC